MEPYPAHFFFSVMWWFLKRLLPLLAFFLFAGSALINAAPQGLAEGHLKIISPKEVELADETPSKMTAKNYIDYPLVIFSRDKKTEVTHVQRPALVQSVDRTLPVLFPDVCAHL